MSLRVRGPLGAAIAACALAAAAAPAAADPSLVDVELRAGWGVELGGAGGAAIVRPSSMTFGARAAFAIREEPATWAYVGGVAETGTRTSGGLTAGVRLAPRSHIRLGAGGLWIVTPYSLYGAVVSAGACGKASGALHLCADLEATLLFGGSDLPEGRAASQLQLVFGARFDAM